MNKITKIFHYLFHNRRLLYASCLKHICFIFPDKLYLSLYFQNIMGYKINWNDPKTFNEKLQWLKVYDRKDIYTKMVDKRAVKDFVSKKIGNDVIIPTINVYNSVDEINFDNLPQQFVLKTTHDGGNLGVCICSNKSEFDKRACLQKLAISMKRRTYYRLREWPYKNVKPCIIAEKYLSCSSGDLIDYKVMCFNGKAKLIQYHEGRNTNHTQTFFNENWIKQPFTQGLPMGKSCPSKPLLLEKMLKYSEILSEGITFLRVDWYIVKEKLFFGELTFYDASGFDDFEPNEYNYIVGSWISLPFEKI